MGGKNKIANPCQVSLIKVVFLNGLAVTYMSNIFSFNPFQPISLFFIKTVNSRKSKVSEVVEMQQWPGMF